MSDESTDIERTSVRLPVVIGVVAMLVTSGLSYWVNANEAEIEDVAEVAAENAKQIAVVTQAQAVTQTQINQILEVVKETQQDARETHDAVIRIEAQDDRR